MLLCSRNARPRCMRAVRAQQPLSFFFSGRAMEWEEKQRQAVSHPPLLFYHAPSKLTRARLL